VNCPLCNQEDEDIIFQNILFRVILINEIPGYIRIITQKHIKEFSDLEDKEIIQIMQSVKNIEKTMIKLLNPDKINIAEFGNMVPHLHFHIIPRYINDPWWPASTFCKKVRNFTYPEFNKNRYKKEIKACLENL
jgi:diadenosine tetraphosphate (Ap4A) HIT family hydrolase